MSTKKKPALGKGLSALLENSKTDITSKNEEGNNEATAVVGSIAHILISQIETNPFQPRTQFEKQALIDLTTSIKEHGVIQPITVRKIGYDKYQIISGERRFRASQLAGLDKIPAYIRIANDQTMLEMAIVENVQRQDLNPIEVALSYQRLIDECDLTQEQLSDKVGKSRSNITNFLRILNLPDEVQAALKERQISMGHAKAILSFPSEKEQLNALQSILENDLSVRAIEEKAKETKKSTETPSQPSLSLTEKRAESDLSFHFNTKVNIAKNNKGGGKIVISFDDAEHLQKILDLLE